MTLPDDPPARIAAALRAHPGEILVIAHTNPDGDALGSVMALARALRRCGKEARAVMGRTPRFLAFLRGEGEVGEPLAVRPEGSLVVVCDTDLARAEGVPLAGGPVVMIDHHVSNPGGGDLAWIDQRHAACTMMIGKVIDALGIAPDADWATPCLVGLLTDTGLLRFGNTDARALADAGRWLSTGIDYGDLTDRLQWRHPDYFRMLARVMASVRFEHDGALAIADLTLAMREAIGESDDDSDDFVGLLRYAEGVRLAVVLRERPDGVKLSVRSRGGASARRVCLALGGGGHEAAAGATLAGVGLAEAEARLRAAAAAELARLRTCAPG